MKVITITDKGGTTTIAVDEPPKELQVLSSPKTERKAS